VKRKQKNLPPSEMFFDCAIWPGLPYVHLNYGERSGPIFPLEQVEAYRRKMIGKEEETGTRNSRGAEAIDPSMPFKAEIESALSENALIMIVHLRGDW